LDARALLTPSKARHGSSVEKTEQEEFRNTVTAAEFVVAIIVFA
jgi:hypothetical protein